MGGFSSESSRNSTASAPWATARPRMAIMPSTDEAVSGQINIVLRASFVIPHSSRRPGGRHSGIPGIPGIPGFSGLSALADFLKSFHDFSSFTISAAEITATPCTPLTVA